jgi:hypothetical protein
MHILTYFIAPSRLIDARVLNYNSQIAPAAKRTLIFGSKYYFRRLNRSKTDYKWAYRNEN